MQITGKLLLFMFVVLIFGSLVSAQDCWQYTTESDCNAQTGCIWMSDAWGSWCAEQGCWNYFDQESCINAQIPGKNCTWQTGGTWEWCEQTSCYSFDGTNSTVCVNNSEGLNCQWQEICYSEGYNPSVNCWNITSQSECLNTTGCAWGMCSAKGCWNYNTQAECEAATGEWGNNCTWNSQYNYCYEQGCWDYTTESDCVNASIDCIWKYDYCTSPSCWAFDFTNASACVNNSYNLSCQWDGTYCTETGCWNYNDEETCNSVEGCSWRVTTASGWCEEVGCWNWDSWNGGNQSICENNPYGLSCVWQDMQDGTPGEDGWCYMDVTYSCANMTTERDCMETYYCLWEYNNPSDPSQGGICKDPTLVGDQTFFEEWNPGCYIFDMNQTNCGKVLGCNWTGSLCEPADDEFGINVSSQGIRCEYINDSRLCNNIAVLGTCCTWKENSCHTDRFTTRCWDELEGTPQGIEACEDVSMKATTPSDAKTLCEQIAGDPWYMPCEWDNTTNTCKFKADEFFGNYTENLILIDNKKACEAAGGKWIVETYCEGNVSVPAGHCEYKLDEERNCNKACFACEFKFDGSNYNSSQEAREACIGSKLGFCEFINDTTAPNGYGYCRAKEEFKKGIVSDCKSNCGDCTYQGDPLSSQEYEGSTKSYETCKTPSCFCTMSPAGCKWVSDDNNPQGGYCISKDEKTCAEACDRCDNQDDCLNKGRTAYGETGACEWDTSKSLCTKKGEEIEVCWDGVDNNDDGLMDCADPTCFADPYCGFVEGGCFGWPDNDTCISNGCTWMTDSYGSWCDYPGADCWKYDGNQTACMEHNDTCQWFEQSGTGWCEVNWEIGEVCMGLNQSACQAMENCTWTEDPWCNQSGAGTEWCNTTGGWCDYIAFAPKNCWMYDGNQTACEAVDGCNWEVPYEGAYCGIDYSVNCWQYSDQSSCESDVNCGWMTDSYGSWCDNKMQVCWQYSDQSSCEGDLSCNWLSQEQRCEPICFSMSTESECNSQTGCIWITGWCYEDMSSLGCSQYTDSASCMANVTCKWHEPGYCDPIGFAGTAAMSGGGATPGMSCYKYDGNETGCNNMTGCSWFPEPMPFCDIDWSRDCWQYVNEGNCTANNCWWYNDTSTGTAWCTHPADECWMNASLQNENDCNAKSICNWTDGMCQPTCFMQQTENDCSSISGCRWMSGWCNPLMTTQMFDQMEAGEPVPLGGDEIGDASPASVDIVGFGMKDMGEAYGFGVTVNDISNASMCNKEKLQNGQIGSGTEDFKLYIYLDTDGEQTGGCTVTHATGTDSADTGYEFKLVFKSIWNSTLSKSVETHNAFKCENSRWEAADIKLSSWKKVMCSEIGGGMIAVDKADLAKFSSLYSPSADMRVYVATANNETNASSPADIAGPGWTTPGAIDFEIQNFFAYGADTAKFEDILMKGFVEFEDCFNDIDDDNDGLVDCYDYDCKYVKRCDGIGVNAPNYTDTTAPRVVGVKIEEYPDSALIMYDTNKPTNGTVLFYYNDSRCSSLNATIYDIGILKNTVRAYKTWHKGEIYNGEDSLSYSLEENTTYYFKLKVCDDTGKCAVSKCSSFRTTSQARCGYCNFVTRLKTPSDWVVSYDADRDGTYEHIQGQMCGPNAGMKSNYTMGRRVNIKLEKSDGSAYIEFLNATLTKTGLNDNVRTINGTNAILEGTATTVSGSSVGYVGMISETRDKIINNLHPEVCLIKIPSSGTCSELWHCDDNGENCVDMTNEAIPITSGSNYCIWQIPYCEFSIWAGGQLGGSITGGTTDGTTGGTSNTGSGSSTGTGTTYVITDEQFEQGITKILSINDSMRVTISDEYHYVKLISVSTGSATISVSSTPQEAVLTIGMTKKIDVTDDNYYDLAVTLNSVNITANSANITLIKASGIVIPEQEHEKEQNEPEEQKEEKEIKEEPEEQIGTMYIIAVILIFVVILFFGWLYYHGHHHVKRAWQTRYK